MARTLRFGIAGIGNEGRGIMSFFDTLENLDLTAVADLRVEALDASREDRPSVKTFDSVAGMCQSGEVDAIWIATPNPVHAEHAIAAAEAGVT